MDPIEILARLDWITPMEVLFKRLLGVRSHKFKIPRACGWSGQQIEQVLSAHGIKVWGRDFSRRFWMFHVKETQAHYATYLMRRSGLPVTNPYQGGQSGKRKA